MNKCPDCGGPLVEEVEDKTVRRDLNNLSYQERKPRSTRTLTVEQAAVMRQLYAMGSHDMPQLMAMSGLSHTAVHRILMNWTYYDHTYKPLSARDRLLLKNFHISRAKRRRRAERETA